MASRRNYVTAAEVNALAGFTPTDDQISEAEELVDAYVGFQDRYYKDKLGRLASGGSLSTLQLNAEDMDKFDNDYFKWCEVEILGGAGAGQRRTILSSTRAGILTMQSNWTTPPDATSFYRIYQLGKFPRCEDIVFDGVNVPNTYYKQIPEAVKRAVAMQCEYAHAMGADFFSTDKSEKQSENIGDYGYTNAGGNSGSGGGPNKLLAPKAKTLLRGIMNRGGEIVA